MKRIAHHLASTVRPALLALGLLAGAAHGAPTDLNDIPMAVTNQVKANFLVVLDNSQSMDALMSGALQSGDTEGTRSNLGRAVLRGVLDDYRNSFRWGLMSFDTEKRELLSTHVYYLGNDKEMVFTDQCVGGISATNGLRCLANPQSSSAGDSYVTYKLSSDDPSILDVFYYDYGGAPPKVIWGSSPADAVAGTTDYNLSKTHDGAKGNQWAASEFVPWGEFYFTPTDSGYLAKYPEVTRQFYLYRGWGYRAPITGGGDLREAIDNDSDQHYNKLISSLAAETNGDTPEIKNAALYTPLAGTLESAKDYFSGQSDWRAKGQYTSPIGAWCQQNFVMLLTDGLPTGNKAGKLYSEKERDDTCSQWNGDKTSCVGTWNYGKAAKDSFDAVAALRQLPYTGCDDCAEKKPAGFDVHTYVVAMGDNVANARAVAVMNEMARLGSCELDKDGICIDSGEKAFFAADATTLKNSIIDSVNDAVERSGAAAAVAVANANITEKTAAYQSSYESANWTGDLASYLLDMATGAPKGDPLWSAQKQLDVLSASSRKIVSYNGKDGGIQFQPSSAGTATALSTDQEKAIDISDAAGIVNYIRGERSGEQASASGAQKYRRRTHLLGDIVNSEPVPLAAPGAGYKEATDPGYDAFKTANATRQALVFQGANDGMLHAFNADTGAEEWAYVPSLILPTIAVRTRVSGFSHRYYVDGTPTVGDVDFSRTAGSSGKTPDWRTILVGGLGKGGYGYYALDVTSPLAGDEAAAAAKVLWEFPNTETAGQHVANLGYSFGKPIIAKAGDQGWVVLVSSGYNNTEQITVTADGKTTTYTGDGKGHLFVLNARTGAVIRDIATDSGSTSAPSGLAAFSGYADNASADNTVTQVYGGDLNGNVWRFDLTGAASGWNVSTLAALVDSAGKAQPVTTAPELASIFEVNASYRFVYVGTGQYLGDSDVTTTATQTMYGLVDDLSASPTISPLRGETGKLQQQTLTDAATGFRTSTSNEVVLAGGSPKRGWYIDLPVSGERVSTDPQLALGSLVFTSNIPSGVPCVPGGSSYLNILDYRTGGALDASVLGWSSKFLGEALASRPVLVQLPGGELRALIRLSSGETIAEGVPAPLAAPKVRRVSWRELPDASR